MKAIKIFSALLAGLIICLFNIARVSAQSDESEAEPELVTDAKSAILIEPTTLAVIYEKNADDRRHPASMTKIMTMILIMEAVKKGVISFSDTLYASNTPPAWAGRTSISNRARDERRGFVKSIAINSANDSAVVSPRRSAARSQFRPDDEQQGEGNRLHRHDFQNPHGLPEAGHLSTARDMALMGAYLVNNHPEILKYTSIYEDYVREDTDKRFWLVNTNKLVRFVEVDGIKTGWTNKGYCHAIKRDNKRFIAVVMGGSSAKVRNQEIMQMLNYALGTTKFTISSKRTRWSQLTKTSASTRCAITSSSPRTLTSF